MGAVLGLTLETEPGIEIPGVPGLDAPAAERATRVRIDPPELARRWSAAERTPGSARELNDGERVLLTVEPAPPAGWLLAADGLGRILVTPDGAELICDPEESGSEWTALLTAHALPLSATLQGFEVLHASGVVVEGKAALFTGHAGAGKSSLAAALVRRGAALLGDDTVALELGEGERLTAHPGPAQIHLRETEHEKLSAGDRATLGSHTTFLEKRRYSPRAAAGAAEFGALFLLERSAEGPPVERIEAIDPKALLGSTFNLSVQTPERLLRQLDVAVAVAATKHVYRLSVQPGIDAGRLAEIVYGKLTER